MPLSEYLERIRVDRALGDHGDWILYGMPSLPPAEGEDVVRVSFPHAELWRLYSARFIENLGGAGSQLSLGREIRKRRGLPQVPPPERKHHIEDDGG
jgi:hypothetical protein